MGTSHLEGQPHGSLLATVDAFLQEHRRCGDLDAGADGDVIWMNCDCGAGIAHPVEVRAEQQPAPHGTMKL